MTTLSLRNLLGRAALVALLPLSLTACDDDTTPSDSGSESDTETDDDDDSSGETNITVTATTPTSVTDTTQPTATDTDTDSSTDTETTADDSSTSDDETTGDTEGTSGETTGDTEETTGGVSGCAEVTIDGLFQQEGAAYVATSATSIGEDDVDDLFQVEFYDFSDGPLPEEGVDLASVGLNDNYETCDECFRSLEDFNPDDGSAARQYFQAEGTLTASEPVAAGAASLTFAGVRLVEVTIDAKTLITTVVDDGACIDIVDGTYGALPPAWTCGLDTYADGATCDCGCGVVDPDCADGTMASCDECNGVGSCGADAADCDVIAADDNSSCAAEPVCEDASIDGALDGGDDTYDRSFGFGGDCVTSALGNDVAHDVLDFTAPVGGSNVEIGTCGNADFDSYVFVYQAADGSADPFDPDNPCVNLVAENDDDGACGGGTSQLSTVLVAGEYQVVVAQYDSDEEFGDYTLTQTCI